MKNANKILIIFMVIIITILNQNVSYAEEKDEELSNQQEQFKISDFLQSAKQYEQSDFFEGIDTSQILNNAIKGKIDNSTILKKVLNLIGGEVTKNIKSIISILTIIIIHTILKSISDSLENDGIAKLIYYVQYILIVTIIMTNFTEIIKLVQNTSNNLVGFMNLLVPLLIALITYTGGLTTSSIVEPLILFLVNFVGNIIQTIIIPLVLILTSLVIISKISDKVQIDKLSSFLKSGTTWFLGVILTIFVGVVSLEGTLASSVDGITTKTAKTVVSSAIPVVGKILGDAVDTVLRLWNSIKKCNRNSWGNNCIRNLHKPCDKTCNINNFI